jgi:predicted regulator of Ras-like GTPase activity (Roadblock/LC7/MglB family)
MSLRDVLKEMLSSVEGALGVAVVRLDGEVVDAHTLDGSLRIEKVAPDLGILAKVSAYAARKLSAGPVDYSVVSAEKYVLLLSAVEVDYALVIALRQGGNLGKARLQVKKNLDRVAAQLRSLVS